MPGVDVHEEMAMNDIGGICSVDFPIHTPRRRAPSLRVVDAAARPRPGVIELANVSRVFTSAGSSGVEAVAGVSAALEENTATLVEGPSGSGKTTLLSLIGCMVRPTAGRITVAGHDVTRLPEDHLAELRRRLIGFVFQSHNLIRKASALENVMLPAVPGPGATRDISDRAHALLTRLGVSHRAHERVERLSGGECQRVAIARALINDPPIIIADEPTAHLDSMATRSLLDLVATLLAGGKTLVIASHDPTLCASDLFAQVLDIDCGRLEQRTSAWS